ncbi:MAG: hypothetical protein HKN91_07290 [Acidimicrobiia bacterium]|nr:hypothetical protein [Acidimicrobiia bacterium]
MIKQLRERDNERGAVLLMIAVSMVALLGVAAVALDLAGLRLDRSLATTTADNAATAGAAELATGGPQSACDTALAYIQLNMDGVTFSGADCTAMPPACTVGTSVVSTTATGGTWTATIRYPVPDGDPLLDPGAIGATTQSVVTDDGIECERIGVEITNDRNYYFAAVIGATSGQTDFHAVARGSIGAGSELAINLLILERYDCRALGASGNGQISVDAVYNPTTMVLDPGWAAVESDASGAGCAGNGTIDGNGLPTSIRADGPEGCPTQSGTHLVNGLIAGEGCGEIRTLAAGTPGCNPPACTSTGTVNPPPERLARRITRAPVDHQYNCKASYSFGAAWAIDGCPDAPAPYIDQLVAAYGTGTPAGFQRWNADLGHPCHVTGPPSTVIEESGNIHVDCANLRTGRSIHFTGGNVIFDGDISLNSGAVLAINADTSGSYPFSPASNSAVFYMRNGEIEKAGQASFIAHHALGYLSSSSFIDMQGGASGTLLWTAPTTGNFEDLAMWSEGSTDHDFAGQATLELEGVFFAPWATIVYTGLGGQEQVDAQFISRKLEAKGNGLLVVRPNFDRAVLVPNQLEIELIR